MQAKSLESFVCYLDCRN